METAVLRNTKFKSENGVNVFFDSKLLTILFGTKYTVMFDKRYQQVHRTFFTEFKTSNISARWTNQYKSMR